MTLTTTPSTGQELIWGLFVKKKGLSIYCQSCKAWVGWAKVNQKAQPNFMEMDNDGRCSHYSPGNRRTLIDKYAENDQTRVVVTMRILTFPLGSLLTRTDIKSNIYCVLVPEGQWSWS